MQNRVMTALALVLIAGSAAAAQTGANAIANAPLINTGSYAGTTVGSTNDGTAGCGGSATSPDVWFKFVATPEQVGGQVIFETCGATSYDSVLSIHTGATPATAATNAISCNDDVCGLQSRLTLLPAAGVTYYIRVAGYTSLTGSYTLTARVPAVTPPIVVAIGPDITIFELIDVANFTRTSSGGPVSGTYSFAVGTTSCNPGDYPAEWQRNTPLHPVIAQNMYRLSGGRFEQIGQSFVKHGFLSLNNSQCGSCISPPNGGDQLGINCSDPYGAGLNGSQSTLGPRSQINATTGEFAYTGGFSGTGAIARRLQVPIGKIDNQPAGTRYFVDAQYISQDDAQFNNGLNNSSFREMTAASVAPSSGSITFTSFGDALGYRKGKTALWAWKLADAAVKIVNADYLVANPKSFNLLPASLMASTITARFQVASKVTANGDGTFHYEYVISNVNADRSAGKFILPMPAGATVTNVGFAAPLSHTGEPYSNAAWTSSRVGDTLVFSTQDFAVNANANAVRWSTAYTFRFDANVAATTGDATIGLFKPGTQSTVAVIGIDVPVTPTCLADLVGGDGNPPADGSADGNDFTAFLNGFAADSLLADLVGGDGNPPADGSVDGNDFTAFLNAYAAGC